MFGVWPEDQKDLPGQQLDIESKSNPSNVESTNKPNEGDENIFKLADLLDKMILDLAPERAKEQALFDKVIENTIGKKP